MRECQLSCDLRTCGFEYLAIQKLSNMLQNKPRDKSGDAYVGIGMAAMGGKKSAVMVLEEGSSARCAIDMSETKQYAWRQTNTKLQNRTDLSCS